ncbi:MAG: rRNA maturation RNase YbeY [Ruminococcaceae bacterium]|nr:rRNA maturation RNase YbeY [Oscillospiraceae bacterium]
MKTTIYFLNDQDKIPVSTELKSLLRRAIRTGLTYEGFDTDCEVSLTFTDNEKIHVLNKQYRNVDRPTDVLSFPTDDEEEGMIPVVLGDIVLSLEKAQAQAEEYGHSFERETSFLTVHSLLHLLGYDHETSEEDEKEMFGRQKEIMALIEAQTEKKKTRKEKETV